MLARITIGTVAVMVGVLLLAAVLHRERQGSLPGPTGEKAPPGLARYYEQQVDWSGCRGGVCGSIRVPLDYSDPGGRTIELQVKLHPAVGERTKRLLFVNPGGPGASAFEYVNGFVPEVSADLRAGYGIVGVDPRGVGTSEPVECLTKPELDEFLDVDPTPDDSDEVAEVRAAFTAFGRACVKNSGDLVAHVSTEEVVRDMDVARAVLGQSKLDFYGASYGTQIGSTYAHLFPRHTGRMVLDAGVDTQLSPRRQARDQAVGFEKALRRFLGYCAELDPCPLGDDVDAAEERVAEVLAAADAQPLESTGVRDATEGAATRGIAFALYDRDRWPALVVAMSRAMFDDGTALRQLADKYDQRDDTGYDNNSTVAYHAVRCLDFPRVIGHRRAGGLVESFRAVAPVFGPAMAWSIAECSTWPVESANPQEAVTAKGVRSIMVVGTTRDPATPYAWSVSLAEQLGAARLVTRKGDGHTGYLMGNRCIDRIVENHLLGRAQDGGDLTCDADGTLAR